MKKFFVLFLLAILIPYFLCGYFIFQVVIHPIKYQKDIEYFSSKYDLSSSLIASIINVESSYKTNAKSNKKAIGLMQIKLETANYLDDLKKRNRITENELFEEKTNIDYGTQYLLYLTKKFENIDTVICAYNAGETRVRSWLSNSDYSIDKKTLKYIPYKETENYLKKIKENLKFYFKIYK